MKVRPSLTDLTALQTKRYHVERAASPAPSYESMHSDVCSRQWADNQCRIRLNRRPSSSSHCSSNSSEKPEEESKEVEEEMLEEQPSDAPPLKPELLVDPSDEHPSLMVETAFKSLQSSLQQLSKENFQRFKRIVWERYPERFRDRLDSLDLINLVDKMLELCGLVVSLKITVVVLKEMNLKNVAEYLEAMRKR
ncbi:protein NLRC3-like, partial [Clarias magur]